MKETMLGITKSSRPERRQSSARPASLAAFAEATGLAAGAAAVAVAAVAAAAAAIEFFYPSSPARAPLRPRSLAAAAAAVPPACSCLTCVFLSAM